MKKQETAQHRNYRELTSLASELNRLGQSVQHLARLWKADAPPVQQEQTLQQISSKYGDIQKIMATLPERIAMQPATPDEERKNWRRELALKDKPMLSSLYTERG